MIHAPSRKCHDCDWSWTPRSSKDASPIAYCMNPKSFVPMADGEYPLTCLTAREHLGFCGPRAIEWTPIVELPGGYISDPNKILSVTQIKRRPYQSVADPALPAESSYLRMKSRKPYEVPK